MILLLAAPAAGAAHSFAPSVRDVVLPRPSVSAARISATAQAQRYPIGDGSAATVAVAVTDACRATCTDADPQEVAGFIGTLLHGPEIELLTVQLDTPFQLGLDCGFDAEACYYPGQGRMVVSGNDWTGIGGATREFVIAHEYGHHLAEHRASPAPFPAAIEWGPPRWSSQERVCEGTRAGRLFPRDTGYHYYQHPGEAFAEAFARLHFPRAKVAWRWIRSLRPDAEAFRAIREDALAPWKRLTSVTLSGRFPPSGRAVVWVRTPLDGQLSLRPRGSPRPAYRLAVRHRAGRVLRTLRPGIGHGRELSYTVCGQARLAIVVEATPRSSSTFRLQVQRP